MLHVPELPTRPETLPKQRRCLNCDRFFDSPGVQCRLCPCCTQQHPPDDGGADYAVYGAIRSVLHRLDADDIDAWEVVS